MVPNPRKIPMPLRAGLVAALLLTSTLGLAGCGDDEPAADTPTAAVSDVTGLTLIRSGGQQVVRAQVLNPTDESSSYTVTIAIASNNGTKLGSTTVEIADVPAGKKKSGTSDPLSPPAPARSQLIVTAIDRTVP
jgi:hypothetical protein